MLLFDVKSAPFRVLAAKLHGERFRKGAMHFMLLKLPKFNPPKWIQTNSQRSDLRQLYVAWALGPLHCQNKNIRCKRRGSALKRNLEGKAMTFSTPDYSKSHFFTPNVLKNVAYYSSDCSNPVTMCHC